MRQKTIGASELARELGISRERVYQLDRAGKIHREKDGKFDLGAVRASLARNLDIRQPAPSRGNSVRAGDSAEASNPVGNPTLLSLSNVQLQHEIARATKAQLEVKRLKGVYVDASEVKQAWGQHITAVRSRALLIPSKLAPRLAAEKDVLSCQEILEREIRSFLTELSEYKPDACTQTS